MKRIGLMKRVCLFVLLPPIAFAAVRDDYARQWPLTLQDDAAGAYRITLEREVYRSARLPSLRDVDVVDADGTSVPSAVFTASQPLAQGPRYLDLPWFPLPAGTAAQAQDIAVISERAADGSVRRVETRVSGAPAATAQTANAWLIDASRVRETVVALELSWSSVPAPLDVTYRIEGSDDLRTWHTLQSQAQLLDLVRDGQRLQQRRITLDGRAKYMRLLPAQSSASLPLVGVRAEMAPLPASPEWTWETLAGGKHSEGLGSEQDVMYYEFSLQGRFPIERVDIALDGNNAAEWTLQSRDAEDAAWLTRAGPWVAFRVGDGPTNRSATQALTRVIRDRHWRLSSRITASATPTLRLAYRPEVVVFVAQGKPPFALVAGSTRAQRSDAPLPQLIDALRARHGVAWQPASTTLGAPELLAGDAAYVPVPTQRDWKAWLLWALLVGGALVVAGFAFSLLRKPME